MKDKSKRLFYFGLIIVFLGLIFRLVNFKRSFFFAHDQDLYSWIAKDIVINHHQRLVGQITSVDGVFIGSFYYYVMAFFYGLSGMNPMSAIVPITFLALFNIFSFYFITKKHFGIKAGLIACLIYTVSFGIAKFDRWSVPTLPTLTWGIWFIDVILELLKGNLKALPLYGFLTAFIWQIHIALIPILPLPMIAYLIGENKVSELWSKKRLNNTIIAIGIFLVTFSPFLIFEFKYNFSQIKSMVASTKKDIGAPTGKIKFAKIMEASGIEIQQRLFFGFKSNYAWIYWMIFTIILSFTLAGRYITVNQVVLFLLWIILILTVQFYSKRIVSEYYFTNLVPMYIVVISVFLANLVNIKYLAIIFVLYLLVNFYWLIDKTDEDQSYMYRQNVVEYIKKDMIDKNYPCIAVNFISDPGVGVGFRYLFWYYGIDLVKPGSPGVPVYNIPIPWQLSREENPTHFGRFGVLLPVKVNNLIKKEECKKAEYQLDPLLGYTE